MFPAAKEQKTDRVRVPIRRFQAETAAGVSDDTLAVEEPLEIRLGCGKKHQPVSITMRTPGSDAELAVGFLFTEGILPSADRIASVRHCGKFPNNRNTIRVDIDSFEGIDLERLQRNFYTTSSCGVCGKSSLEALAVAGVKPVADEGLRLSAELINGLPAKLDLVQDVFAETGGLHAAALFDERCELTDVKEDVGRHNAVDKLIGAALLANRIPLSGSGLFLSGRASFELVQKAAAAGIGVICAVGAPSSLAVAAAIEFNITLVGFVRDCRFNVYSGEHRFNTLANVE